MPSLAYRGLMRCKGNSIVISFAFEVNFPVLLLVLEGVENMTA